MEGGSRLFHQSLVPQLGSSSILFQMPSVDNSRYNPFAKLCCHILDYLIVISGYLRQIYTLDVFSNQFESIAPSAKPYPQG
jgi:hypothetical protein